MSRSYRHTPIMPLCGGSHHSEKWYKRYHAGQERVRLRECFSQGEYELAKFELVPWDEWDTSRDGKQMIDLSRPESVRWMRK